MAIPKNPLQKFLFYNGLSVCMFGLFAVFLIGLSITGHTQANQELQSHGQPLESYAIYITSGSFIEAVFENWESEFLAVGVLLVLSIFLRQRGSPESKVIGEPNSRTGS